MEKLTVCTNDEELKQEVNEAFTKADDKTQFIKDFIDAIQKSKDLERERVLVSRN